MSPLVRCLLLCSWIGTAYAQSPPPDRSPAAYAGEWVGAGELGSYCYVALQPDGWGRVLVDGGSGDWLGARIQWRNLRHTLVVDKVIPSLHSPHLRILPLETLVLRSGFNQSMSLTWNGRSGACQLQRSEKTQAQLARARSASEALQALEVQR